MPDRQSPYTPASLNENAVRQPSRWWLLRYDLVESTKALSRTLIKAREVQTIALRPGLAEARIVAALVVKDEAARLPYLLAYYRRLGVEHFLLVDNESTDHVLDLLGEETDVSTFAARGDYRKARFGNDWINLLLRRHCPDKWVLWIDADEFIVISDREDVGLQELVTVLDTRGQKSLQAVMLDMYSDRPPNENTVEPGADPLVTCDLYDRSGYPRRFDAQSGTTWIKGGPRGRLFFDDVWSGPALNKTPLVKWRTHYAFLKSSHQLWPRHLNGDGRVHAALLHLQLRRRRPCRR